MHISPSNLPPALVNKLENLLLLTVKCKDATNRQQLGQHQHCATFLMSLTKNLICQWVEMISRILSIRNLELPSLECDENLD